MWWQRVKNVLSLTLCSHSRLQGPQLNAGYSFVALVVSYLFLILKRKGVIILREYDSN